jgi:hypothetical protein
MACIPAARSNADLHAMISGITGSSGTSRRSAGRH